MGGKKRQSRKIPPKENRTQSVLGSLRAHPVIYFLLLSGIWVLFLYHQSLAGSFLYDDTPQIRNNPNLLSWRSTFQYFRSAIPFSNEYLTPGGSFYRPLFWISLAIDRRLWGLDPAGFHATNLVSHWINGFLLFLLLRRANISDWISATTAFLWLALPINSEVVAWISARCISISTLFVLSSLLAADSYLQARRIRALLIYSLFAVAAMLSHELGVLAFPLALLWAYFKHKRPERSWMTLSLAGIAVYGIGFTIRYIAGAALPIGSLTIGRVAPSFFQYLQWMIFPVHMSVERSTDLPPDRLSVLGGIEFFGLILLAAAAVAFRDKWPRISLGLAWIFLTLLPFCGIVPLYQGMAERYLYIASIGLVIVLVNMASTNRLVTTIVAIWAIAGVWRLQARVPDWSDEFTLDKASLRATPESPVLLYNLAVEEANRGDLQQAMTNYRHAIAINPHYASALLNLGNLLRREGQNSEAVATYQQLLRLDPENAEAWTDLGNAYTQTGSWGEAERAYEKAINLRPANVQAIIDLGALFQRQGQLENAKRQYEHAIAVDPRQGVAYCNLGTVFLQQGDTKAALNALKKSIDLDPTYPAAYFDLGVAYERTGSPDSAIEMYKKALALKPDYENARARLESLQNTKR
jgi:tetratricopeptide (TPR) repeat protein